MNAQSRLKNGLNLRKRGRALPLNLQVQAELRGVSRQLREQKSISNSGHRKQAVTPLKGGVLHANGKHMSRCQTHVRLQAPTATLGYRS